MAQTGPEITAIVARFRQQLASMGIEVEQMYLFGSHASGRAREGSDIDLIVVSGGFRGRSIRERGEVLGVAAARILEPIQALGVTPEEIAPPIRSPFLSEVLAGDAVAV